ncbi:MAG: hypothetical protein GXP25_03490 [Planctomycetes bacterium]|nr:hypothetical protein [Planctomycetota bacterium]
MQVSAEAKKSPTVEFKLCKGMAYPARMMLIFGLLALGLLLQLLITWWIGLPFVFAAGLFSLYKSTTNKPKTRHFGQWENVTLDEFIKVQEMLERTAEWKRKDPMAIASPFGCFLFVVLLGLVALIAGYLWFTVNDSNAAYTIAADGLLLLLFVFGSGSRKAWEPPGMKIKLEPLLNVCRRLGNLSGPTIEVKPMLELQGKGEEKVPCDCKLMLQPKGAPEEFLGIQVQTSLNSVQGTNYPYMYCVLLAKTGSGLTDRVAPLLKPNTEELGWFANANDKKNPDLKKLRYRGEVAEPSKQKDVELVVIRQVTLGTGYHTEPSSQIRIVQNAIHLTKTIYDL